MKKSMYKKDKRKEELFSTYLDNNFYKEIIGKYKSIIRNSDVNMQNQGVDVIIETHDGETIYIDEKAALHYINKNIPTFAFEIKNTTSGAQGWLFNPNYITNYYLLAWPNATDIRIPNAESFKKTDVLSIRRSDVIKLLEEKGLTEKRILELVQQYQNQLSKNNKFEIADGIKLHFNQFLREKPINVIIRKELLKKYAKYYGVVK